MPETVYELSSLCESIYNGKKPITEAEDKEKDDDASDNPFADTKDADTTESSDDDTSDDTSIDDESTTDDSTPDDSTTDDTTDDGSEDDTGDSAFGGDEGTDEAGEDTIGTGDSVSSEEYSDIMNFGITLIMLAAQVHFWHINCHKGFEHETLQGLYIALDSLGDKLLENTISVVNQPVLAGNELSFDFGNLEFDKEESVGILEDIRSEASDLASRFQDNQGLCGILGDISEAVGAAIYKLTQFDAE